MSSEHKWPGQIPIMLLFLICMMFINHYLLCASFFSSENVDDDNSSTHLIGQLWGFKCIYTQKRMQKSTWHSINMQKMLTITEILLFLNQMESSFCTCQSVTGKTPRHSVLLANAVKNHTSASLLVCRQSLLVIHSCGREQCPCLLSGDNRSQKPTKNWIYV